MYPSLPTSLSGAYAIGATDQEVQGNIVTHWGKPFGVWYDDTVPGLEHWLEIGQAKYEALGQKILVCVPPGRPDHHYPAPIISVYEAYFYGMGCPFSDWLPLPRFDAYCVQKNWPGTHGKAAPTEAKYQRLLKLVQAKRPKFIFLF